MFQTVTLMGEFRSGGAGFDPQWKHKHMVLERSD